MEKEEEATRELLLPNWQGSGSHGLTIAQRDDGVFVQEVMQNSPAARTGVVKEGDQIVGATIYFDNLQSGEVTQLLNTMGHHTVGLKLHRKGDRSPEPGQTWTHEVFSSRSSEVVLSTAQPSALDYNDQNKPKEAGAAPISTPDAGSHVFQAVLNITVWLRMATSAGVTGYHVQKVTRTRSGPYT
ncbi:neuroblast differentiation-associated protein AHNAK isoform X2 [Meriones unguiculatus]|uniref:neuroblast differentiation-associated protein AHNAK isoform X2 n=1 Tax=Meriones unguiculatus TaxID=10047 RepID=UPI00293F101F|nr:neuroblast differentiation-associated protein AHNAK isoform X2 [Meriones unguiculatus]